MSQRKIIPGVDAKLVAKRLHEIVADLIKNGPTADEVQRVATTTVSSRISGLESVGGFGGKAVALASGELYSGDPAFYKKQLQETASVTPARVRAAPGARRCADVLRAGRYVRRGRPGR